MPKKKKTAKPTSKKEPSISIDEAWAIYSPIYDAGAEAIKTFGTNPINNKISIPANRQYYTILDKKYEPWQVISSARAFGDVQYRKALKSYHEKLENWKPESGKKKPSKPHRDSLKRYIAQMARHDTRRYSPAQAKNLVKAGFEVEEYIPIIDEETGEVKKDPETDEPLFTTRKRRAKVEDVYYRTQEEADKYFWDPIRKRRAELSEQELKKEDGFRGVTLADYLYDIIAQEFFGSDPKESYRTAPTRKR